MPTASSPWTSDLQSSVKWEWTQVIEAFSFPNSAGKHAYLVYCEEDVLQTNQGGYVIWYLHVMCYLPLAISFTIICVSEKYSLIPGKKKQKKQKSKKLGRHGNKAKKITHSRIDYMTNQKME